MLDVRNIPDKHTYTTLKGDFNIMRQLERLFGKLKTAEQQRHAQQTQGATRISRKMNTISATLSKKPWAPHSARKPSSRRLLIAPPAREVCSTTITSYCGFIFLIKWATDRPERPPPTITTSCCLASKIFPNFNI